MRVHHAYDAVEADIWINRSLKLLSGFRSLSLIVHGLLAQESRRACGRQQRDMSLSSKENKPKAESIRPSTELSEQVKKNGIRLAGSDLSDVNEMTPMPRGSRGVAETR